jgi:iron complex outermembrane receptor protein
MYTLTTPHARTACARTLAALFAGGLACCAPAMAAEEESRTPARDLADFSIEELANIQITSVAKNAAPLSGAPASVFVITGEEILGSGATSLPEALRLAPNLQVSRVDARNYAVTARGFNSAFENKLLVLIDGRTVYSPLFSGVFWDAQDVVLADIARIEVISGPGATLWGANAVNGVINIITRSSAQTVGTLAHLGADRDQRNGALRYGGELANGGHYRVYGKYLETDDTPRADGAPTHTAYRRRQAGFRLDWEQGLAGFDNVTVQGDAYSGSLQQAGTRNIEIDGVNLLARGERHLGAGADLRLQMYIDRTGRDQPNAFTEKLDTFDVELQHTLKRGAHNLVVGAGYRHARDRLVNGPNFGFLPPRFTMHWGNAFVQDEIALNPDLKLTLGLKGEHNMYTGMEWLPNMRLALQVAPNHLLWSSLSRAVRVPSRIDRDLYSPPQPITLGGKTGYLIGGGPDFVSEVARAAEVGYRAQPSASVTYALTAYYGHYDRLRTLEPNPTGGLGSVFLNRGNAISRGLEAWASLQATGAWRLSAGFVAQRVRAAVEPGSMDTTSAGGLASADPDSYWQVRSSYDFGGGVSTHVTLRHVGALDNTKVPAYTAADVRVAWRIHPDLDVALIGHDLGAGRHPEFGSAPGRSVFRPGVGIDLLWRY